LSGMGLDLCFGLLPVKRWKESTEKHELWQMEVRYTELETLRNTYDSRGEIDSQGKK